MAAQILKGLLLKFAIKRKTVGAEAIAVVMAMLQWSAHILQLMGGLLQSMMLVKIYTIESLEWFCMNLICSPPLVCWPNYCCPNRSRKASSVSAMNAQLFWLFSELLPQHWTDSSNDVDFRCVSMQFKTILLCLSTLVFARCIRIAKNWGQEATKVEHWKPVEIV